MTTPALPAVQPAQPHRLCTTCSLRILTPEDVPAAHILEVMAGEELGDGYRVYNPEQLYEILTEGMSIGVFSQHQLIALRLMRKALPPKAPVAELLRDVPWQENRLCYLPGSFVHPDFRRQGLSSTTTTMALEQAQAQGMDWCYATVAPNNFASIRNLEKMGFRIQGRCRLYNDSPRYVMVRPPITVSALESQNKSSNSRSSNSESNV